LTLWNCVPKMKKVSFGNYQVLDRLIPIYWFWWVRSYFTKSHRLVLSHFLSTLIDCLALESGKTNWLFYASLSRSGWSGVQLQFIYECVIKNNTYWIKAPDQLFGKLTVFDKKHGGHIVIREIITTSRGESWLQRCVEFAVVCFKFISGLFFSMKSN
jgi:hypothetical protein